MVSFIAGETMQTANKSQTVENGAKSTTSWPIWAILSQKQQPDTSEKPQNATIN